MAMLMLVAVLALLWSPCEAVTFVLAGRNANAPQRQTMATIPSVRVCTLRCISQR